MGNGKKNLVIIIVLSLLAVGLGGYIVYEKVSNNGIGTENKKTTNNDEIISEDNANQLTNNTYNVEDYVVVSDFELNENCIDCGTYGTVKKIEFKELSIGTTAEFIKLHENFIYPNALDTQQLSNTVTYSTNNNILSVYTTEKTEYSSGPDYNFYSLNVNLDNNKIITNEELIKMYNLDINSIYEKILNNLATTVTVDQFLLDVYGDILAPTILVEDFKNNISDYVKTLNNKYDIFTLYVKDNKVNLAYSQREILALLGMGSHMDIGLVKDPTLTLLTLN